MRIRYLTYLMLLALLSGCGQKGDLYLPRPDIPPKKPKTQFSLDVLP